MVIPSALRHHTGGVERLEVAAPDVRGLLAELERRFPGIGEPLRSEVAVAIDGEIVGDALFEPIEPTSEVHFLPKIGGGR